jgi:hypothetical protein
MNPRDIQRYVDAWKKGDDATVHQITRQAIEGGDDSELVDLKRSVEGIPYGSGK